MASTQGQNFQPLQHAGACRGLRIERIPIEALRTPGKVYPGACVILPKSDARYRCLFTQIDNEAPSYDTIVVGVSTTAVLLARIVANGCAGCIWDGAGEFLESIHGHPHFRPNNNVQLYIFTPPLILPTPEYPAERNPLDIICHSFNRERCHGWPVAATYYYPVLPRSVECPVSATITVDVGGGVGLDDAQGTLGAYGGIIYPRRPRSE